VHFFNHRNQRHPLINSMGRLLVESVFYLKIY